ncbi:UDP-N-acetylmuramate--L-alanine ligase [Reichenbachiella carrageenanivorans]|uniref:UDP-N-acetylmuramate--L-alanine ligase n=1 Tax=Reichenbachiella carrageenanivorans TaxID=2979869 RepID=A0ABY6CUV3_9BACT|nr:UDP-N-acetylmuramate--L-alanine ligase [Reichenbachiella carrageenanivorans]UXX77712.1 UDP-N-acetylmuramate--L-alanine ligase [Reichenbachiella carrageenanivorans]
MKLEYLHSVYFLGIGGIGMSALARWFHANGFVVTGYDKTSTELTEKLVEEGMAIHFEDNVNLIPEKVKKERAGALIIYTPAVPKDLGLYQYFVQEGFELYKRSQVLGMLTESKYTIAVAGTHGKTTTSSMVAHLLRSAGVDCSAFVGGIMTNYDSNLLIGENNEVMVVEADEFDRSFLTLHPDVAIITATDADHLDIYGSKDALKDSFNAFIKNIKANGQLFVEEKVAGELELNPNGNINVKTYGLKGGEVTIGELKIADAKFAFDYQSAQRNTAGFALAMPGYHNVSNAIAAIASVSDLITNDQALVDGLNTYKGVKRRFEYIIQSDDLVFIDDYAHHPEEIKALIESVRALYPTKKITVIFQPHLFTRTRDFVDGFAESLSMADEVLLLDIYPARELPIEGVTSEMIKEKMTIAEIKNYVKDDVLTYFDNHTPEVLITVGAGNIDTLVSPIKRLLEKR